MKPTHHEENLSAKVGYKLLPDIRPVTPVSAKWKLEPDEQNISAVVGFLVLVIIFWIGYNLGVFVTNKLKEPTWHSPKGCPLFVPSNTSNK